MHTLLVIEDEVNIRTFIEANFEARGFRVIEAESAEDGIAHMRGTLPDVIILDIFLPQMNGWEFLTWLVSQAEYRHIPVIVLTASLARVMTPAASYENVVQRLIKPVTVQQLLDAVNAALNYRPLG